MKRDPIVAAITGMLAFGVAHALVTSDWLRMTLTPDPTVRPWFTNSSRSVLATAAVVAVAALAFALGAAGRRAALTRGIITGAGALVAMVAVLLKIGAGTLGPIVAIVGGVVLLAAGLAGGGAAAAMKKSN